MQEEEEERLKLEAETAEQEKRKKEEESNGQNLPPAGPIETSDPLNTDPAESADS